MLGSDAGREQDDEGDEREESESPRERGVHHASSSGVRACRTPSDAGRRHRSPLASFTASRRLSPARPAITYPSLADDVAALMESVGLESVDVFGCSVGAVADGSIAGHVRGLLGERVPPPHWFT